MSDLGKKIGDGIGGIFHSIHGAGEAMRGNINSALDGAGDGIAGRKHGEVKSHGSAEDDTAEKGVAEMKSGFNAMSGHGAQTTASTTTTNSDAKADAAKS